MAAVLIAVATECAEEDQFAEELMNSGVPSLSTARKPSCTGRPRGKVGLAGIIRSDETVGSVVCAIPTMARPMGNALAGKGEPATCASAPLAGSTEYAETSLALPFVA
jgi:hypothetical protein